MFHLVFLVYGLPDWVTTSGTALFRTLVSAIAIYASLILLTRLGGLRSFSKMSTFDFAMTVAIGSLVASVILSPNTSVLLGVATLAIVFALQLTVAHLRQRSDGLQHLIDNEPLLLMAGREVLHDNLRQGRVTMDDLRAKLREANVINLDQVRAVVMETTGDISVLHADPDGPELEPDLFSNVRGREHLTGSIGLD